MLAVAIALCVFYVVGCVCLGALLGRLAAGGEERVKRVPASASVATAFLLGEGALACVWVLVALPAWFSPPVVAGLLVVCVLGGGRYAWREAVRCARSLRPALGGLRAEAWPWVALAVLAPLPLLLKAAVALMPPHMVDAVSFYLALPKAMAASHRLVPLPGYEFFTQVGLQGELHFAALMSLGSERAATLFLWSNGVALAALLLAVCAELGLGRRAKIVALVALSTSTAFTNVTADGKVDLFAAAFGMAAFYWALRADETAAGRAALRLTGLLTGLAVVAKLSYIPVLVPGVLLLVVARRAADEGWRKMTGAPALIRLTVTLAVLGLWAALPLAPHLLKNGVLFGEPFAPFGSTEGRPILDQTWFAPEVTRRIVLTYPLVLAFGQYPMQYGNLSPLVLALAPLGLLMFWARRANRNGNESPGGGKRRGDDESRGGDGDEGFARADDRRLLHVTMAAVVALVVWVVLRPSVVAPRYILAPLLLFIPLAAYGAEQLSRREARPRWVSAAVMLSLFFVALQTLNTMRAVPAAFVRYEAGRVPECSVGGAECAALSVVNGEARPGDRVYLASYPRYWLRPDLLQCVSKTGEMAALTSLQTADERWARLYEQGFRYLVTDRTTHGSTVSGLDPARAPDWLELTPLYEEGALRVIRLEGRDPAREPRLACRQAKPPAWDVVGR